MDRRHDEHETRRSAGDPDRRVAARAAREEVAEILAGALWSLICAGKGPRPPSSAIRDDVAAQAAEMPGV